MVHRPRTACLALLLALLAPAWMPRLSADDVALISVGDVWRYSAPASEPAPAWKEPGFDDSNWAAGRSGFGISRWGENTLLEELSPIPSTVCFRREFEVTQPEDVGNLVLRVDWQGGFVAFLNGREVARRQLAGVPGTPVPFEADAGPRYYGSAEDILLTGPDVTLRPGRNVLAIQLHPIVGGFYPVVLVPELLNHFTRGPYLQEVLSNRARILWRTATPQPGRVRLSRTPDLADPAEVILDAPAGAQEVLYTQLTPGTRYYYQVRAGTHDSPVFSFRTLPQDGDLRFAVFGDSGAGSEAQFRVADQLKARAPDLMVHLGDIVYPHFSFGQTDTRCLSVYRDLLRTTPSFFAWGNHDIYQGFGPILDAFRQPTNNTPALLHASERTVPECYFSFDAGPAHFAVLFWPYSYQYFMREDCPQLKWLEEDLAGSTKPWKFLFLHHPVNTSGGHRNDDYNFNGIHDRLEVAARLMPVAARHGVQLIFSGHDHNYERFHPIQGTHTVVTGGGGIILYGLVQQDANSAIFQPRWHFSEVTLRGDRLQLQAIDASGSVFDALEFRRTPPASPDPDGDGLGPEAERLAGTRPDDPDTDGDGRNDGWEWLHGRNPKANDFQTDGSHLAGVLVESTPRAWERLGAVQRPDGGLELRWLGAPGEQVLLESAASPDGAWGPALEGLRGQSLDRDPQRLLAPTADTARFYRIRRIAD